MTFSHVSRLIVDQDNVARYIFWGYLYPIPQPPEGMLMKTSLALTRTLFTLSILSLGTFAHPAFSQTSPEQYQAVSQSVLSEFNQLCYSSASLRLQKPGFGLGKFAAAAASIRIVCTNPTSFSGDEVQDIINNLQAPMISLANKPRPGDEPLVRTSEQVYQDATAFYTLRGDVEILRQNQN